MRVLKAAFVIAVASFAWLRFSDNTVDNDLWGHVLYGQRYWNLGAVRGPEAFSWTAPGFEIVNHEYLAEIVMGWVHRAAGGTGLWLYMLAMASLTVACALGSGRGPQGAHRWPALFLFAGSINFIALGFAVRPQLFTTLALVVELILLRRLARGHFLCALALPPLIALWINFHGGVLAGILILFTLAAAETAHAFWPRPLPPAWESTRPPRRNLRDYWSVALLAVPALLLNPWGFALPAWNLAATLRPRPQIAEWQPMFFSAAHAPYYLVALLSLLAWTFSRQPKKMWEAATLLLLAAMGLLHQRHAPLFGLANIILSPPHLADAARRLAPHCRQLLDALARPLVQAALALALLTSAALSLHTSFAAPKEHPFTMEVEKNVYPVAAVEFIRAYRLFGKTITFFDWGQQNLWELPDNPVSFDGRFDTGYPPSVIAAHWDFYAGKSLRPEVNWSEAEVALLPTGSGGVTLLARAGWLSVYTDPLATVLLPAHGRHAALLAGLPPLRRSLDALHGRDPFPDAPAALSRAPAPLSRAPASSSHTPVSLPPSR